MIDISVDVNFFVVGRFAPNDPVEETAGDVARGCHHRGYTPHDFADIIACADAEIPFIGRPHRFTIAANFAVVIERLNAREEGRVHACRHAGVCGGLFHNGHGAPTSKSEKRK
jgi:hypothetical protein